MKNLRIIMTLLLIIASFSFITCSNEKDQEYVAVNKFDPDTVAFDHSMKGYELYSWPNGDDWNYSILPGTNRTKTLGEVTGNPITVFGSDSLKMLLDKMPVNENIFWVSESWLERCWGSDYGTLSLPDDDAVNDITAYCIQKQLVLLISD